MSVCVEGIGLDGSQLRVEWHLTARDNHGPEVPCIAAVILAKHLAKGAIGHRGAFPCMGFLSLEEFESQFARWKISTTIKESAC